MLGKFDLELKFNDKIDRIQRFIFRNINFIITSIIAIASILLILGLLVIYKNNKIKTYNAEMYQIINSKFDKQEELKKLEELYSNKSLLQINKTIIGFELAKRYNILEDYEKSIAVFENIYHNEKEPFFKYYAGLNLLNLMANRDKENSSYIDELYLQLNNRKNPLLDLTKEQYALYLMSKNQIAEAKEILKIILNSTQNQNTIERIRKILAI